ncbi:MAG: cobalt-precorrin-6A reductase [Pseudomonadota bacterium]
MTTDATGPRRILILGGTLEANKLAAALNEQAVLEVITSLAGRTAKPKAIAGQVRVGGFGGADGLKAYLKDQAINLMIDATHPFAAQISSHAAAAADQAGIPLLRLCRPAWQAAPNDRWIGVDGLGGAAKALRDAGSRVLLTTGRQGLGAFSSLKDHHFVVRLVDAPREALPLPSYEVELGRGPFSLQEEVALLERHSIHVVVAKNSGGPSTAAKLDAARTLNLPVIMIERPRAGSMTGHEVETVEAAEAWIGKNGWLS